MGEKKKQKLLLQFYIATIVYRESVHNNVTR